MAQTGVEFDDGYTGSNASDATYTYIRKSLSPGALDGDKQWLCKRYVTADGTFSFANGVTNFSQPEKLMTLAQTLTATYTR
jgi:hypothetical protein